MGRIPSLAATEDLGDFYFVESEDAEAVQDLWSGWSKIAFGTLWI